MIDKRTFLSYSWNDNEDVNRLDNLFLRFQIQLTRDIRDLEYNANIHNFMDNIKKHDNLILYVSDSYLRSVNCMYEASQVLDMKDKVIIIMKKSTKLFGVADKMELINYWKNKLQEISQMDPSHFQQEINDTKIAYNSISAFIDFIKQDNRMNEETLDFNALLDSLQVEKAYPNIISKPVFDWIAKYSEARLFDVLALINDLYRSTYIHISEFPNIPDNEVSYMFQGIRFESELNGISLLLSITNEKNGEIYTITYPHLVAIEENTIRSDHHAKYYFYCENPSEKQKWIELINRSNYSALDDEEKELMIQGYKDIYRMIVNF